MKFGKVTIKLASDADAMQDGYVVVHAGGKVAITGDEEEVKRLVKIIQQARAGSAVACIELLEYGKSSA